MKRAAVEAVFGAMKNKHGGDCHVATSPRRDVSTSRRLHVVTSARDLHPSILKYGRLGNPGIGRRTRKGTVFQSRLTQTSRKCPGFVLFLIVRYYFRHEDDVFDTRHLDLFFHNVLDFFLGLHQTLSHTMD